MFNQQEIEFILKMKDQATQTLKKTGAAIRQAGSEARKAEVDTKRLGRSIGATVLGAQQLRRFLIGGAFTIFTREAITNAIQFEKTMTQISGLTAATTKDVEVFKGQVKGLAVELGKSPRELAEGLFFVSSAGFKGAEAMEVLSTAAKASAAGLGTTKDLVIASAAALNAYGKENISAGEALSVVVKTAEQGLFSIEQLASGLGRVTPTASALGVNFKDLGAVIAAYTKVSGDANTAITATDALLRKLATPSEQGIKLLKDIGLSVQDVRDSISKDGLLPTLSKLNEELGNSSQAWRKLVEEANAVSLVNVVLGNSIEDTKSIFKELNMVVGNEVSKVFDNYAKTDAFKVEQAQQVLNVAILNTGQKVLPLFAAAVKTAGDFVTKHTELLKDMLNAVLAVSAGILTYKGLVLLAFGATTLAKILQTTVAVIQLAAGIRKASEAQALFNLLVNANPYVFIASAIATVVGLLVLFRNKTITLGDTVGRVGDYIIGVWDKVAANVNKAILAIYNGYINIRALAAEAIPGGKSAKDFVKVSEDIAKEYQKYSAQASKSVGQFAEERLFSEIENIIATQKVTLEQAIAQAKGGAKLGISTEEEQLFVQQYNDLLKKIDESKGGITGAEGPDGKGAEKQKSLERELETRKKVVSQLLLQNDATKLVLDGQYKSVEVAKLYLEQLRETNPEMARMIKQQMIAQQEQDKLNDTLNKQRQLADSAADAITGSFKNIITGAESAREAVSNLAGALAEMIIQAAVLDPIKQSLSAGFTGGGSGGFGTALSTIGSFFFNKGGVFSSGTVLPFYGGGIVNTPTRFPMAGGRTGMMGETREEGILPLTRLSNGDLGVSTAGSNGSNIMMPVSVTVNMQGGGSSGANTGDSRENARRMGAQIADAIQVEIYKVMDKESRPGGRFAGMANKGGLY